MLDWVLRRCDDEPCYAETPLGNVPSTGALNTENMGAVDMDSLFSIPKDFWMQEVRILSFFLRWLLPRWVLRPLYHRQWREYVFACHKYKILSFPEYIYNLCNFKKVEVTF